MNRAVFLVSLDVESATRTARVRILEDIQALRTKSIGDLRALVKNPTTETLMLGEVPIELMDWAKDHGQNKVAVIVEARRRRFLGCWSQVAADGFYKDSDGITSFQEKDYYEHGY